MAQTGVIIRRNAGRGIPNEYLQLALQENPTAWGASIVTPEGIIVNSQDEGATVEIIQGALSEFKERDIVIYLCNSESAINMDDVSPHDIMVDGDKKLLIAYVEGEFTGHKKVDSTHPSSYYFIEEYLQPKIAQLYELTEDFAKMWSAIEKPLFKKELLTGVSDGTVTLVAFDGKTITFHAGKDAAEYEWGWVSNNYGYAMAKAEPPKETVKPKSMFPKKSTVREAHVPKDQAPRTEAAAVGNSPNYTVKKERVPLTHSRKDRKGWHQRRIGYCPIGWDGPNPPEIEVIYDGANIMTFSEQKRLGLGAAGLPKLNNPPRAQGPDLETTHVKGNTQQTGPALSAEALPVLSPKTREFVKDVLRREDVKKLIAENGDALSDPSHFKKLEEKVAPFSTQLGMQNDNDLQCLPLSVIELITAGDTKAAASWIFNLRNEVMTYRIAKKAKAEADTTTHTVAKEELKPEKKSMFPKKNVA